MRCRYLRSQYASQYQPQPKRDVKSEDQVHQDPVSGISCSYFQFQFNNNYLFFIRLKGSSDSSGSDTGSSYSSSSSSSSRGGSKANARRGNEKHSADRKVSSGKKGTHNFPVVDLNMLEIKIILTICFLVEVKKQDNGKSTSATSASASTSSAASKKTTRREELLKQLRAVEDAIARKRQKQP